MAFCTIGRKIMLVSAYVHFLNDIVGKLNTEI